MLDRDEAILLALTAAVSCVAVALETMAALALV